jgi:small-conductance mechanosensitive channel
MLKRFIGLSVVVCAVVLSAAFLFSPVFAQETPVGEHNNSPQEKAPQNENMVYQQQAVFAQSAGLSEIDQDPRLLVVLVAEVVMSLLGITLVLYAVYGGYIMMTSNGDSEQVTMGKTAIVRSIIGVIIIVSGYSLARFVGRQLEASISKNATENGLDPRFIPGDTGVGVGNGPQDPLFERDDNFCVGIACDENGIQGHILPNTPNNGSGFSIDVN